MSGPTGPETFRASALFELMRVALSQHQRSGLVTFLKAASEAVDAYGCVVWQEAPGGAAGAESEAGSLVVLAHWLKGNEQPHQYYLPMNSATGHALIHGKTTIINDIYDDPNLRPAESFLQQAGIKWLCSVPISFPDGARGALNVYRTDAPRLSEETLAITEVFAGFVPTLYQAIGERVALDLVLKVTQMLRSGESLKADVDLFGQHVSCLLGDLCRLVAQTFQCLECSIYLRDPAVGGARHELAATTLSSQPKDALYPGTSNLAGWVLANAKAINVFDIVNSAPDRQALQATYPGVTVGSGLSLAESLRHFLATDSLPPVSVMAVPVEVDGHALGLIRCGAAHSPPYYFSARDVSLLQLVATQLSAFLANWLSRRGIDEENRSWLAVVEGVGKMNEFALGELTEKPPDEHRIFAEGLRVAQTIIREADSLDIRLIDVERSDLYFAQVLGRGWDETSNTNEARMQRFPLSAATASAGSTVVKEQRVLIVNSPLNEFADVTMFPDTGSMIVAPISSGAKLFGVLDIRFSGPSIPRHAEVIAGIIGQQLGLYHYLAATIRSLVVAESEVRVMAEHQTRTYEDLQHQLRSPILNAQARLGALLTDDLEPIQLRSQMGAIRGLLSKADRITRSVTLFADLTAGRPIRTNLTRVGRAEIIKLLIEAAVDAHALTGRDRDLRFEVDRSSFERVGAVEILLDRGLVEQAIGNLLDNAAKYSFPATSVRIFGSVTKAHFSVSVTNRGLRMSPEDVSQSLERGWRSDEALLTTGEGSGIGLWLVSHIMRAHKGKIRIIPTDESNNTTVSLLFPTQVSQAETK